MTESDPKPDPTADEETDAAAADAAEIGGPAPDDPAVDPAQRPLVEGGEGEAEGFELAEEELIEIAEHGDQHRFPDRDAPLPEELSDAEYGEPDQVVPDDE